MSVNFRQTGFPLQSASHRILPIHQNIAGVISRISQALAGSGFKITGETLRTTQELGYALLDVNGTLSEDVAKALRNLPGTIEVRILY
jgi:D-3-phosphoglycerate dehydrogenase